MFKRFVYKSGLLLKGTAGAINEPTLSSVQAATAGLIVTAAYQTIQIKESRRSMTFSTQKKDGGKIASNKPLSVVLQEFEASLDANELRPLIAENAEELLKEAADAVPFAPGTRGSRRKKRQRERLRVVRRADYIRKLQKIAKHEQKMQRRSAAALTERLGKLGLSFPVKDMKGLERSEAQKDDV